MSILRDTIVEVLLDTGYALLEEPQLVDDRLCMSTPYPNVECLLIGGSNVTNQKSDHTHNPHLYCTAILCDPDNRAMRYFAYKSERVCGFKTLELSNPNLVDFIQNELQSVAAWFSNKFSLIYHLHASGLSEI